MPEHQLDGQVAIVTGASRGIGRATAAALGRLGASVVGTCRKAGGCADLIEEAARDGAEAMEVVFELGAREESARLADETLRRFSRVDILVCNAGINPGSSRLDQLGEADFDEIFDANVKANWSLAKHFAPGIASSGGGSIVFVASIAGLRASQGYGAYGMSKAACMSMARTLAVEWGPQNIRVNCVAPGLIRTELSREVWTHEERLAARLNRTPLRRMGTPEEIGGIIAFLASPAASFITGQVIPADGGVTITL